jgi:tRNA-specific 2-thiouridylase
VDAAARRVTVGDIDDLGSAETGVEALTWVAAPLPVGATVRVQTSAHGRSATATFTGDTLRWSAPYKRVAPGQTVAFYDAADVTVVGAGIAT